MCFARPYASYAAIALNRNFFCVGLRSKSVYGQSPIQPVIACGFNAVSVAQLTDFIIRQLAIRPLLGLCFPSVICRLLFCKALITSTTRVDRKFL